MKGYERLSFVVLVILCCAMPGAVSRNLRGDAAMKRATTINTATTNAEGLSCVLEPKSFWIRNTCHGGFITMTKDYRDRLGVYAQHSGLTRKSERVELMKESCHDERGGFLSSITTRIYAPYTDKYICFNKRGKIVTKSRKNIRRMGRLCAFTERKISPDSSFVRFQSSYDPEWYLGFNGKRQVGSPYAPRLTLPRRMRRKNRRRRRKGRKRKKKPFLNKCDFAFTTGEFNPDPLGDRFPGLLEHVRRKSSKRTVVSENDIVVDIESSPQRAYYYIESNDERYRPSSESSDEDDEDEDQDKEAAFINFESQLRTYKYEKSTFRREIRKSGDLRTSSAAA